MSERIALGKRIRFEIFKRDGFSCQYCGRHPPEVTLEIDHIIPVCDDGDASEGNLLTACSDCNRGKGGRSLTSVPQSLAAKAAVIAEREEQLAGYREIVQRERDRIDEDMWNVAFELFGETKCKEGIKRTWLRSIKQFNSKLEFHVVLEAAEIAMANMPWSDNRRFLYFCGICWRKIKGQPDNDEEISS